MSTWNPVKGAAVWMVNDDLQYEAVTLHRFTRDEVVVQLEDLTQRTLRWNDIEPLEVSQSSGLPLRPFRLVPDRPR